MQNMETLQMVKEQLKLKNKELKKKEKEKAALNEKINNILQLNQKKLGEMKLIIDQKDLEIKHHQELAWAARAAKHVSLEQHGDGKAEEQSATATAVSEAPASAPDPELLQQVERLKERDKELKEMLQKEQHEAKKLDREKTVLLKELKRMRQEAEDVDKLKDTVEQMKAEAKQLTGRSTSSVGNFEQLLREKDEVIASYEKMLYGNVAPGMEGMLPSEIIVELQEELETLERERKEMIVELEQVKEQNEQLEMKITVEGGKGSKGGADASHWANLESRETVAAEFHLGLEKFLISYADLITLLLVMFIFLYSISKIDDTRLAEALSSIQEKDIRISSTNIRLTMAELRMLDRIRELVKDNVDPESLVRSDVRTILIRLNTSDLFGPGSAELIEGADQTILNAIKEEMREGVKQVLVEGHTDDVPIKSAQYPSNWELSSARASKVARFIMERLRFPPDRLVVAGYGEYRPLEPNDSDDHRAINRRVEIKILKDKTVAKEEAEKAGTGGSAPSAKPKEPQPGTPAPETKPAPAAKS